MAQSKREQLGQIVIRPPAGMRDRIKAAAEVNKRSMNAEIIATLEEKYPPEIGPSFTEMMREIYKSIMALPVNKRQEEVDRQNKILKNAGVDGEVFLGGGDYNTIAFIYHPEEPSSDDD